MKQDTFEELLLPHFDASYNLARWLTGSDSDAEDLVQEAYLRAFAGIERCQMANPRAWLFAIVRNACFDWIRKRRAAAWVPLDDGLPDLTGSSATPEALYQREVDREMLRSAMERLLPEFREVLVLREFEELSYREISEITQVPIGTVMSRLARARRRLREELCAHQEKTP